MVFTATELAKLFQVAKNRLNFEQKLKDQNLEPNSKSLGQELKAEEGGLQAGELDEKFRNGETEIFGVVSRTKRLMTFVYPTF
jgi:hypothetical protein